MADELKLTPEQQVRKEIEEFRTFMQTEAANLRNLPAEAQTSRQMQLMTLQKQGIQSLRNKSFLAKQGIDTEVEEESDREGILEYIIGSLQKPVSGIEKLALGFNEFDERKKEQLIKEGLFDLAPFSETFTGKKTEKMHGGKFLEEIGVGKGGSLSNLIPSLFSDTGEGIKLERGGAFDASARGVGGFVLDVAVDPLNFIPVEKGIAAGLKGAAKATKAATGKTPREIAYRIPGLVPLSRQFNRMAFLSRDPIQQEMAERFFTRAFDKVDNVPHTLIDDSRRVFTELFDDPIVSDTLIKLDDATRALERGADDFVKEFPDIAQAARQVEGKLDPTSLKAIMFKNSGLNQKQLKLADEVRNFFDMDQLGKKLNKLSSDPKLAKKIQTILKTKPEKLKIPKGSLVTQDELNALKEIAKNPNFAEEAKRILGAFSPSNENMPEFLIGVAKLHRLRALNKEFLPNYFPRAMSDIRSLDDIGLEHLRNLPPESRSLFEDKILTQDQLTREVAEHGVSVNTTIHGRNMRVSAPSKSRVFPNYAETAKAANLLGGRMNKNISELVFQAGRKSNTEAILKELNTDLTRVFGAKLPPEVSDTLGQIAKKAQGFEGMNPLARIWNKYFLNPVKYSLTMPFPAFHVRNVIDDTFRGYEEFGYKFLNPQSSLDAHHIMKQGDHTIKLGNDISLHANDLWEKFVNTGIYKHQFIRSDLQRNFHKIVKQARELDDVTKSSMRKVWEKLPVNELFALNAINHARVKGAVTALREVVQREGLKAGDDLMPAILEAAKRSKRAFIDIHDLGPMDDILAQFIPFYRFSRKNIPFQLRTLINNPQRISKLAIAQNNFQAEKLNEDDKKALAPYLRDSLLYSLGQDVSGNHLLLSGTGLSIEELNKFMSSESWQDSLRKMTVGQMAPPIQYIYGIISNKHPFFGTELDDFRSRHTYKSFYETPWLREMVGGIRKVPVRKDEKGEVIWRYELEDPQQYFKVTTLMTPLFSAAAARIPGAGGLLSGAVSARGLDTYGKAFDDRKDKALTTLRLLSGLKVNTQDLDRNRLNAMIEKYKEQNTLLDFEKRRLKAFWRLGLSLSAGESESLTADEELDLEEIE